MPIEKDIEQINTSLREVGEQIKAHAEKADKEIKAHAKLSEETRTKVDSLLTEQGTLRANLATAEQLLAKLANGGGGGHEQPQTMGMQVTDSEDFKAFAANPVAASACLCRRPSPVAAARPAI